MNAVFCVEEVAPADPYSNQKHLRGKLAKFSTDIMNYSGCIKKYFLT